jgi:hypothetical protein
MSVFEFVFSLFGLVLGLALTEVIGGLGRVLKSRRGLRVGWLTPLLGLLLLVELTAAWASVWTSRGAIPFSVLTLFCGLAVTGVFYMSANQVFPDALDEWGDLDDYFDRHKVGVICCLVVGWVLLMASQAALGVDPLPGHFMKITQAIWYAVAVALAFVRDRRLCLLLMLGLLAIDTAILGVNAVADPFRDRNAAGAAVSGLLAQPPILS